jgi:hypothetical protein
MVTFAQNHFSAGVVVFMTKASPRERLFWGISGGVMFTPLRNVR